jgi:diadenosine tetraphosphate (Ap4A) HIT family hydrolase
MKRDRDDTDLRGVRESYTRREKDCPFCGEREILLENALAYVTSDKYQVTDRHVLVIPKRHVADYFDLGTAEVSACQRLLVETRVMLLEQDASIRGFNVGINSGATAGQTVMHCHIHLIPRREGDCEDPRGGVRAVIPGKANYLTR